MALEFTVYGNPIPQGSTRAFIPKGWTRPIITAANSKTKPWRQEISACAIAEMQKQKVSLMTGPVALSADFYFERPKSLKKSVTCKTTRPDADKILRSLGDALTGIVYKDDCQIVYVKMRKLFGSPARVEVRIE